MGVLDAMWHMIGLLMPAAFIACLLAFSSRFFKQNRPVVGKFITQSAILFVVCAAVLIAGLFITGRDGKMLTYAAMVLIGATVQWILSGGWRR
jgi:FtsH-binding integral membrane protein